MKAESARSSAITFETHGQQTEGGVEFWLGRDLQHLLGYATGDDLLKVVSKAKPASELSGHEVADHFADVGEMVDLCSGSQRELDGIMLARLQCAMVSESAISRDHITNDEAVRRTLLDRGIRPESLPAAEDVKKVECRLASEEKKSLKNLDALDS